MPRPSRCISVECAKELVLLLKERGMRITTAESCTGGRMAAAITAIPGSSGVFPGGIVSYCDEVKHRVLNVPAALLEDYGAVSPQVAEAMAKGAAALMGTDLTLSATGIAGPDGDGSENPVGTVYIGLYAEGKTTVEKCLFSGSRLEIQTQATEFALSMAINHLK